MMPERKANAFLHLLELTLWAMLIIACNIIALSIWEATRGPPRSITSNEMAEGWDMAVTMCNRNMADCVLSSIRTPPATPSR
jgi:hypothetical protein